MKVAATVAGAVAAILIVLGVEAATQTSTGPAKPRNLAVTDVTTNSIKLLWGPTQPGPFKVIANTPTTVTVGWGASKDTRGPITYQVTRNGKVVDKARKHPSKTFTVASSVKSFKICVQAFNRLRESSVNVCGKISRKLTRSKV